MIGIHILIRAKRKKNNKSPKNSKCMKMKSRNKKFDKIIIDYSIESLLI